MVQKEIQFKQIHKKWYTKQNRFKWIGAAWQLYHAVNDRATSAVD